MNHWIRTQPLAVASLLMVLSLAICLPGLGRPLISREQELRVVVTARNMIEGREWLVPRYHDELRARKPPLMYWMVAGACALAGTTDSDFVMRLPTVLFGSALAGLLFLGGRLLIGPRRALLAAIVAGTSLIFLRFTRLAETDMPQAFFVTATFFSLYGALRGTSPLRWWFLAGLCAGLGFLIKSPAALILPLAAVLTLRLLPPHRPQAWRWHHLWAALLPLLLIALPWYLFILYRNATQPAAAAQIGKEVNALFFGTQHPGPIVYYLYIMVYVLLPWGLLVIPAGMALWQYGRQHLGTRFLLAWLLSTLAVLSLVPSKQEQYATLLLAPCCLAIGSLLPRGWGIPTQWPFRAVRIGLAIPWVLLILAGVALLAGPFLPFFPRSHGFWLYELSGAGILAVAALSALVSWGQPVVRRSAAIALMMGGALYAFTLGLQDSLLPSSAYRSFTSQVRPLLPAGTRVVGVGHKHNSLEFYLHQPMATAGTFTEAWAMTQPGDAIILSEQKDGKVSFPDPARHPPRLRRQAQEVTLALYIRTQDPQDQR